MTCVAAKNKSEGIFCTKSHAKIWDGFTDDLIEYISTENKNINWFLWGNEAISAEKSIKNGRIFKSKHPRLNNQNSEMDFLNTKCFEETIDIIDWNGKQKDKKYEIEL